MASQTYMDRAMRSADPRYARVLEKLGHARPAASKVVAPEEHANETAALRARYEAVVGKRLHGMGCRQAAREDRGSQGWELRPVRLLGLGITRERQEKALSGVQRAAAGIVFWKALLALGKEISKSSTTPFCRSTPTSLAGR